MTKYYYPYGGGRKVKLGERFSELLFSLYYLFCRFARLQTICVDAYTRFLFGKVDNANWGDDLNFNFLSYISRTRFLPFSYIKKISAYIGDEPTIHYFIGSIFGMIKASNNIIWGSGLLTEEYVPHYSVDIRAVRGPKTREVLMSKGISCPEVYGDPALLLPYYYSPRKTKKHYKLGIIPHYVDCDKEELDHLAQNKDVLIINVTGYKSWRDIIDMINSCETIVSSSLHGVIVSEAYGIPNIWVEIKESHYGDEHRRFKFYDFYESIGKLIERPYLINLETTVSELNNVISKTWKSVSYSIKPLVAACPFTLKKPIVPFE